MHKFPTKSSYIGKNKIILPQCHSTNDIATNLLAKQPVREGTVIVTSSQTAGKGQRGNSWESEPHKNLTFSIILHPELDVADHFYLNICISLGVYDFLSEYLKENLKIKWPNDIFYLDNKIGGILIENFIKNTTIGNSVVGLGLNVNQKLFQTPIAISMFQICNSEFDLEELLDLIFVHLERRYGQVKTEKYDILFKDYYKNLYWLNEVHTFYDDRYFTGIITGVSDKGQLMVKKENEKIFYYNFKEIKYIK